ncbi:PD-(D/E)XK nuclease family protein [Paenibacillus polymyxa]|uniref:PD-(D/E)XK nuclease family protein n=1 Tax=Paenibacillus polymyxa TaxID=1406 RepID=UPI00036FB7B7|nr:PD-(D/E)XK nuclease family protein [Paenibacillus polymyxa]NMP09228.1 PD-(D/E)XK nuclease family protein [Paenibacillus polymyxa]
MAIYPSWSYSQSRAQTFDECLRKYYYHYYGSHNGWNSAQGTEEQVTLYRLKQLSNLYILFGNITHQMCESVIRGWMEKGAVPRTAFLETAMKSMLNDSYKESLHRELWLQDPKNRVMLAEIYYDDEVLPERIARIKERQHAVVHNLYRTAVWRELQQGQARIVEVEKWDTMLLHETKVYVKMDYLYRRDNGDMVIVDWKTGKEGNFSDQLFLYASYVQEHYQLPLEKIEVRVEYLMTGEHEVYRPTPEDIDKVVGNVGRYIEEMKSCLDDDYYNRPKPESFFTPMPSRRVCGGCNFREVCKYRAV